MFEEIQEEMETLGYLYTEDELEIISPSELNISIKCDDDSILLTDEPTLLAINFTLPPLYPTAIPTFEFTSEYLLDEEIKSLSEKLRLQCIDSLGIQMIYNVVQWLKEEIEITIQQRKERLQLETEIRAEKREEEERIRYQGTRVTPDSFKQWQKSFIDRAKIAYKSNKHMCEAYESALAVELLQVSSTKLTGKQMFETGNLIVEVSDELLGEDIDYTLRDEVEVEMDNNVLIDFGQED